MPSPASLIGAWSLGEETAQSLVPVERRRAAMEGGRYEKLARGRLWLACAPGRLAEGPGGAAAWDGFLAAGADPWTLHVPPRGRRLAPAGHYVAARAETERGLLHLTRDPSGGERLYFAVEGGLLLFASSMKALLRLRGRPAALDEELAFERGVAELACFGARTLVDGVSEVLPGHRLTVERAPRPQEWLWETLLEPVEGDESGLAWRLRESLKDAVARCIGREREAAVALSGGIDSAAVAALAVELLGPERVRAYSFEYQDPGHPSEAGAAAELCRRLGIRRHRVVPISREEFEDSAPAAVWSAEDPGYWKRSYPRALARAVEADGLPRFLTGFGIGSHMSWLEDCGEALPWVPARSWTLRYWRDPRGALGAALARLDPGLEPPMHRLLYPVLAALRADGLAGSLRPFFPEPLGERVERAVDAPRVREELAALEGESLARRLQRLAFAHMNSCADVARCERPSRETGAMWLGPAHFPGALPYCYLAARPRPPRWSARRRLRPGKRLLLAAMEGSLPLEFYRGRKSWSQTIGSRAWRDALLRRMDEAAGPSWEALRAVFGDCFEAALRHAPEGMIPLAFWHRIHVAGRFSEEPSWRALA